MRQATSKSGCWKGEETGQALTILILRRTGLYAMSHLGAVNNTLSIYLPAYSASVIPQTVHCQSCIFLLLSVKECYHSLLEFTSQMSRSPEKAKQQQTSLFLLILKYLPFVLLQTTQKKVAKSQCLLKFWMWMTTPQSLSCFMRPSSVKMQRLSRLAVCVLKEINIWFFVPFVLQGTVSNSKWNQLITSWPKL